MPRDNPKPKRRTSGILFAASLLTILVTFTVYLWPIDRERLIEVIGFDGMRGYINADGRVVVDTVWSEVGEFDEKGMAPVADRNGRCGWIDRSGRVVIPLQWDGVNPFTKDDLARIYKGGLSGWINRQGVVVVEPVWDFSGKEFDREGMVRMRKNGKVGVIDKTGKTVIEPAWDWISSFGEFGTAMVKKGDCYGCVDRSGKVLVAPEFIRRWEHNPKLGLHRLFVTRSATESRLEPINYIEKDEHWKRARFFDSEKMAIFLSDEELWGWIDDHGKVVIPAKWDKARLFDDEGMAAVSNVSGKWGWIDRMGEEVVAFEWHWVWNFGVSGMACVMREDGKIGWIDRKGEIVIPPSWDKALGYGQVIRHIKVPTDPEKPINFGPQGLVRMKRSDKWGWINRKGEIVIEPQWDWADDFDSQGMAAVAKGEYIGWINRKGEEVIPVELPARELISDLKSGLVWLTGFDTEDMQAIEADEGSLWINRDGEIVIQDPIYMKRIDFDGNGLASVWGDLIEEGELDGDPDPASESVSPESIDSLSGSEIDELPMHTVTSDNFFEGGWIDRKGKIVMRLPGRNWLWYDPVDIGLAHEAWKQRIRQWPEAKSESPARPHGYVAFNPTEKPTWFTIQLMKINSWMDADAPKPVDKIHSCIAYNPEGKIIWDNRWVQFEQKCIFILVVAALITLLSGRQWWKGRNAANGKST